MHSTLAAHSDFTEWIAYLDSIGAPAEPVSVSGEQALKAFLRYVDVPDEVIPGILAARATIATDPEWTWLLERSVQSLLLGMDRWNWPPPFRPLPAATGEAGRWFFIYVFAAVYSHTQQLYDRRGIPEPIAQATLADIGRHVRIHYARTGEAGLANPDWLMLHIRGMIFQLGRLQFERGRLGGRTSEALQAQGYPWRKGHPVLSVHIPSLLGPLSPSECDASFAAAREFFATHVPDERYDLAVCHSWLMDRQLADYLPETSNIVQFQRQFQIAYTPEANNRDTLEFVFRMPDTPLDELPQRSTLERAVVQHIRDGKSWHGGMGWMPLT